MYVDAPLIADSVRTRTQASTYVPIILDHCNIFPSFFTYFVLAVKLQKGPALDLGDSQPVQRRLMLGNHCCTACSGDGVKGVTG